MSKVPNSRAGKTKTASLKGRIPALDGLRGLAILLVIVWHYVACQLRAGQNAAYGDLFKVLSLTWSGVDLFFVLSGFLIGGILMGQRESKRYFKTYFFRRICRIFPLYFLLLIAFAIARSTLNIAENPGFSWLFDDALPLGWYFAFAQNFSMAATGKFGAGALGVTWSLAVEEQFYLVLPFVIWAVSPKRLPSVLIALGLFGYLFRVYLLHYHPGPGGYPGLTGFFLMPSRADGLFMGVLIAWLYRQKKLYEDLEASRLVWFLFPFLAAGAVLLTVLGPEIGSLHITYFGHTWLALLFAAMLLMALSPKPSWLGSLISLRVLQYFGRVSYGVYLLHQVVAATLHAVLLHQAPRMSNLNDLGVTILALGVTCALSSLSWRYFEEPFVLLGHRNEY